jgi:hypothetical protein
MPCPLLSPIPSLLLRRRCVCVCVALSPCSLSSLCWCASLTSLSRSLLLLLSLRCPPPPHILACTRIHTHRQVNAKRQQKKAEKIAKYSELLKALDEASGSARRGGGGGVVGGLCKCMCYMMLLLIVALVVLVYLAASDDECFKAFEPFAREMQRKGAQFKVQGKEEAIVKAGHVCQQRVELVATRHLEHIQTYLQIVLKQASEKLKEVMKP